MSAPLSVQPSVVKFGEVVPIVAKGTFEEEVASAGFELAVRYSMANVLPLRIRGKLCGNSVTRLPFEMGQISINGLMCPHAAGPWELTAEVTLSDDNAVTLFHSTSTMTWTASDGTELLCTEIMTAAGTKTSVVVKDTVHV